LGERFYLQRLMFTEMIWKKHVYITYCL